MASILIPAVVGVIFYNHIPSEFKLLVIFSFYGVVGEAIGYTCYLQKVNNMPLFHIHSIIEFTFWTIIYYRISRSKRNQFILVSAFICFLIFTTVDLALYTSIFEPNSIGKTVEYTLLIILLVLFLVEIRGSKNIKVRLRRTYSLLTIGLLVFFLGTVFVFFYSDSLMDEEMYKVWTIYSVLKLILNILYAVVIWNAVGLRKYPRNRVV